MSEHQRPNMSSRAEHTVAELQGKPAGVVTRTLAGAVDYAAVWILIGAAYLGIAVLGFLWDPRSFVWPDFAFGWVMVAGLLLMLVYLWAAWSTRGKTLGSVLLGTRVVSLDGDRLDPVRALLRAGFVTIFPIGLFTCVVTPRSRSVHDVVLGTKVVYHYRPGEIDADEA